MKLVGVILLALVFSGTASAIDYPNAVRTPALEAKLPTPVEVYCTQNTSESFAMLADRQVFLDLNTCASLAGQPSPTPVSLARAAHTLYHEWWHVALQETNEQLTECGAYAIFRQMLVRYWHVSRREAQAMYLATWQWSPYSPVPCAPTVEAHR